MSSSTISRVASRPFEEAMSYTLSVMGTPEMILEEEQKEAIKAIYDGKDVFVWFSNVFSKSIGFQGFTLCFYPRAQASRVM